MESHFNRDRTQFYKLLIAILKAENNNKEDLTWEGFYRKWGYDSKTS